MCHLGYLYKKNGVEGRWISLFLGKVMLPKWFWLCFTCESWDTKLVEGVKYLPCEEILGSIVVGFFCVAPLRLGGLRKMKSTPSVGWEVPMKFRWLASRRLERVQVLEGHRQLFVFIGPGILNYEVVFVSWLFL
jgi:hypothetical protein